MKVLFIGGSGLISTAVTKRAAKQKIDLYLLNRGNQNHDMPKEVSFIQADINDYESVKNGLAEHHFDVIVDWIAFTKKDVERDY